MDHIFGCEFRKSISAQRIDGQDARVARNIFKTGTKKLITELINKKIRKYNNLADTVSLKTIGFYNDSIPLTGNIAFEGNGIIFVYNIFDVAPPAKGIQRIFLPFSEIGKFIKPGSVLYPLSRQGT